MATPRFDVIDIVQTIRNRRRFVMIVTAVAMVLGGLLYIIRKKSFKAQTEFFLSNPLYADRNYIFRSHDMHFVDYFAGDDDIDKIIVNAESRNVKEKVIYSLRLPEAYKIDMARPEKRTEMFEKYDDNFKIKRSEYRHLILTYTDTDPQRAADVANEHVRITEEVYRTYYNTIKGYLYKSISDKIAQMDKSIDSLTDTLSVMRDRYKLYNTVSPARAGASAPALTGGGEGFGKAVEEIQSISAIKDQLVIDRSKNISLLNEYSTGTNADEVKFIHVASPAVPPTKPAGPGKILTLLGAGLLGFFFSIIWILLTAYYKILITTERK